MRPLLFKSRLGWLATCFLIPTQTSWSNVSGSVSDCRDATDETGFLREELTAPDVSYGAEFAARLHEEDTPWN